MNLLVNLIILAALVFTFAVTIRFRHKRVGNYRVLKQSLSSQHLLAVARPTQKKSTLYSSRMTN
jgi:hypothetical protein